MFKINKPKTEVFHERIITFKLKNILFNGELCEMLIMTDETLTLNYLETKKNIEVMNQLQSSVTHNMRAPLKCITSITEMMINDNSTSNELLKTIKSANVLLTCQVDSFLDQSLIRNN
jgi:light-regulated signal transduction histidine kinase (bacteriophytochrome)